MSKIYEPEFFKEAIIEYLKEHDNLPSSLEWKEKLGFLYATASNSYPGGINMLLLDSNATERTAGKVPADIVIERISEYLKENKELPRKDLYKKHFNFTRAQAEKAIERAFDCSFVIFCLYKWGIRIKAYSSKRYCISAMKSIIALEGKVPDYEDFIAISKVKKEAFSRHFFNYTYLIRDEEVKPFIEHYVLHKKGNVMKKLKLESFLGKVDEKNSKVTSKSHSSTLQTPLTPNAADKS